MSLSPVLSAKILPPRRSQRTLPRARVSQHLREALNYRLTLLQAGAGYGKSTALAWLAEEGLPLIWYQASEEDGDPQVFLLHLTHAIQRAAPHIQNLPIPLLQEWSVTGGAIPLRAILDQCLNAVEGQLADATLLVIDDVHWMAESQEVMLLLDRFIGLAPAQLHILLSARSNVSLPTLARWKTRGEVLQLDRTALAFTPAETAALFATCYHLELTPEEASAVAAQTEGWTIALQLIWQSLRSGAFPSVETALAHPATSLEGLFQILAGEVFEQQPPDVQEFLRIAATLRVMTAEACDYLRNSRDSAAMLAYLRRQELFTVDVGEGRLRFHNVFHDFLRQQTPAGQQRQWRRLAAEYFMRLRDLEEAIYHLLQAEDTETAADLLNDYGAELLARGRLDTLAAHLASLPAETLSQRPSLLFYLGDLARLHSRFDEALGWYVQAEARWRERGMPEGVGRALRGQARVYLDTVNPSKAEEILQQALRLSDGIDDREAQARLYELVAENKLNAGRVDEAETLRRQAEALRREGPADSQLLIRVLLRTGKLDEARRRLEAMAQAERQEPVNTPRAHRETHLLLSFIYAMQGNAQAALQTSLEGIRRGEEFNSPFVIAVGHMRQGHAQLLLPGDERYNRARAQFEAAIELSRQLATPRLRVEACWGLCQTYGRQGNQAEAARMAQEGIDLASQAGDEWIASLIRLAMGANLTLAARYESAAEWLGQAARGFQECSDPFGMTVSRLWLCLGWFSQGAHEPLNAALGEVLETCQSHGYDFLFTHPTLLGPPDERLLAPLLIRAREKGWGGAYPAKLLEALGLPRITYHPGYQLRIFTLGNFQVWRGAQEIPTNGWRRDKTRQLFQLLLTAPHALLERDQICENLWPGIDPASAQRNFKVALSTLYDVLEPGRAPGGESAYIQRSGIAYGLRPGADFWLDTEAFAQALRHADASLEQDAETARKQFLQALALYQGEFLPDARYETWAAAHREHLAVLFLNAADRFCELSLNNGRFDETIETCRRILAHDNCWERAYRYLMLAYHRLGDHGQIARAYQRCLQTLRDELDVSPSQETESLYRQLIAA